jgi:hypothetical protein
MQDLDLSHIPLYLSGGGSVEGAISTFPSRSRTTLSKKMKFFVLFGLALCVSYAYGKLHSEIQSLAFFVTLLIQRNEQTM